MSASGRTEDAPGAAPAPVPPMGKTAQQGTGATPTTGVAANTLTTCTMSTPVGIITIGSNVVPTADCDPQVAQRLGITSAANRVMLVVGARRGQWASDSSPSYTAEATASRPGSSPETLALHGVGTGEVVDYIGTLDIHPPEVVGFDITVTLDGTPPLTMSFAREFATSE